MSHPRRLIVFSGRGACHTMRRVSQGGSCSFGKVPLSLQPCRPLSVLQAPIYYTYLYRLAHFRGTRRLSSMEKCDSRKSAEWRGNLFSTFCCETGRSETELSPMHGHFLGFAMSSFFFYAIVLYLGSGGRRTKKRSGEVVWERPKLDQLVCRKADLTDGGKS